MNEETMPFEERIALANLNVRLNKLARRYPNVACRVYRSWERVPEHTLTPEIMRSVIRDELRDQPRAKQLEEHVVHRININGVRFLDWERDPGVVLRALPRAGREPVS